MKSNFRTKAALIVSMLIFASTVMAQTMETNMSGLVIKGFVCDYYQTSVEGNLINRNTQPFSGRIRVKLIDSDNDILWQGSEQISVGGMNGRFFSIRVGVGRCVAPNKVQITLEQ